MRVGARRGETAIVRNHLGLTMAAAGIDASNVAPGQFLLLPIDPDHSARVIREAVLERCAVNVAVVVTDTAGRPWRNGQTDIAIGTAGLIALEEFAGRTDTYGNPLAVTAPAVADELAGLSELASGKLSGRPFTLVTGRADLVLPPGEHGTGAVVLIREDGTDMFGYGSREAVVRALTGSGTGVFGAPASREDMAFAVREVFGAVTSPDGTSLSAVAGPDAAATADVLAAAFGWVARIDVVPHQTSHATSDVPGGPAETKVTFQPASP